MAPKSGSPSRQLRASDGDTPVRHCTRPPQHRSVVDDGLLLSILSPPSPPPKQQPRQLNTLPHPPVSTFCQPQTKAKAHHHHHHHHHFSQHFQPSPSSFSTSLAHILRFSALAFQLKHRKQENRELPRIPLLERVSNSSSSSNCTTTCSELEQHFQRKRRRRRHKLQKQLQYFPQPSLSSPPSPPSPTSAQSHSSTHSSAADSGDMPHRQACGDTTARAAVSHWRWWQTKVMLITVVLCLAAVSSSSCQRLPKQPPPSKPPPHQQHQHQYSRSTSGAPADYYYSPTAASATAALTLSSSSSSHSSFSPSSSSSSMLLSSSRSMMMAMKPPYEQQHQQAVAAEIPLPRHQQQQQSRSSSRMSSIPQHYRSAASSAPLHHHKSQHQHQHQHQHQQQQQNFPQSSRLSSVEPGESLNEIDEEEEREREKEQTAAGEDPLLQLENSTPTSSPALNITAQVGHPVYLHCIVESLGDKMVSWIRLRDFHLLTIGSLTYIQDDRFAVRPATSHQGSSGSASNDWSLQIKHVTVRDEGLYECQINSDPPRSQYYYLRIVVPVSEIVGNPDIFVRSGAPINVTCLISSSPAPPAFVFWYHNNRMINYDYGGGNSGGGSGGQEGASGTSGGSGGRGQISVAKDPNRADVVISRLLIRSAVLDDSGNYTCSPSNAEPASTYVHVLQGEKRLSNDIQNDDIWSQSEQLAANNEGHHSAAGAGAASAFSLLAPQYFRFYLFSTTFTFTFTLSISISMTTTTTAFAFLLLSVLNCTFYSRL